MNVVDIHPEELIDKLESGMLSAAERERLDAHLAQCSACRFEIGVRADLEQEAPLFEQRPQLTFAGQQAVERSPLVVNAPAPPSPSIHPRYRRRFSLVLLAAALVLCAGGATAAVVTGAVKAPAWLHLSATPTSGDTTGFAASAKLARKVKLVHKATLATLPSAAASNLEAVSEPSAEPALPAPPAAVHSGEPLLAEKPHAVLATRSAIAQAPAPVVAAAPSTAAFAPVPAPSSELPSAPADSEAPQIDPAASLFADANHARRDGNVDRAVALYHDLQTRYPSSSESELSRALLAQMLLDRGSPEAALADFDRYLAEDAPVLGAEALVGRARALEQLGKTEQAVAAWKQVQSRFPGSVHARLAATRLVALGMR
jgi:TolA-binding protein